MGTDLNQFNPKARTQIVANLNATWGTPRLAGDGTPTGDQQRPAGQPVPLDAVGEGREIEDLHEPIIVWCKNQVPAVPYYHARPDKPSGIAKGCPDFALFYHGHTLLLECKTRSGKLSDDQRDWAHLAEDQGFPVHVIRSMSEFHKLVDPLN
jgi:hypothetical protein